jgi:type IV secretory pathway TrbL component
MIPVVQTYVQKYAEAIIEQISSQVIIVMIMAMMMMIMMMALDDDDDDDLFNCIALHRSNRTHGCPWL